MERVTRRSSRLKQKTQVQKAIQQQDVNDKAKERENDASDLEEKEEKRNTKTARGKHKSKKETGVAHTSLGKAPTVGKEQGPSPFRNVRGRRGFLQYMIDMPLDIVYEIFGELEPVDLLFLSWSCKSLHAIVMDKHARFLWSKAYEALENQPPPCPSDLNYAQYTRFLFVNRCMSIELPDYKDPHVKSLLRAEHDLKEKGEEDYQKWRKQAVSIRDQDLNKKRQARRQAIFEKLGENGWSKEEVLGHLEHTKFGINDLPTFQRSSKLTQGEILSILEEGKMKWQQKRIIRNGNAFAIVFHRWYTSFHSNNPDVSFKAVPYDFMVYEPFLSSILNPNEEAIFQLDEETTSRFTMLHNECLHKRNQVLFDLLPDDMKQLAKELDNPHQVLQLASVWFKRGSTLQPSYSLILLQVKTPHDLNNQGDKIMLELQRLFDNNNPSLRNSNISFDHRAHEFSKYVIQTSENDPMTTTVNTMNSSNIRMKCRLGCYDNKPFFRWWEAVLHGIQRHAQDYPEKSIAWRDVFLTIRVPHNYCG